MSRERITPEATAEEEHFIRSLRPQRLDECIGQGKVFEGLRISIQAAKERSEPVDHILLHGPPGLGKTTVAGVVANEMGANFISTSGPALERGGDLMGILTNLDRGDILFIDEIHRLPRAVEELLYPAMEDFCVNFVIDKGVHARTLRYKLKPFTLAGATTRAGLLSSPLRERFGIVHHLDFFPVEDLQKVVLRSAAILGVPVTEEGALEIARRARGTPRIANRLLRRVRDYAPGRAQGGIAREVADAALAMLDVDVIGFDLMDRKLLLAVIEKFAGGPVGLENLAHAIGEETDTIEDVLEPFLIQQGFGQRTPRGRVATLLAYRHFGLAAPRRSDNGALFEDG